MASPGIRVNGLSELVKTLRGTDIEVRNGVKKVNRKWTNVLRDRIRAISPRTGGTVRNGLSRRRKDAKKKSGPKHDTRPGSFRASIKSRVGADWGVVMGGEESRTPHFVVNEFGGAVWWHRMGKGVSAQLHDQGAHRSAKQNRTRFGGDIGHIIPVRRRSPMTGSAQTMSGGSAAFPRGYYFFPTVDENIDDIFEAYWDELCGYLDRRMRAGIAPSLM